MRIPLLLLAVSACASSSWRPPAPFAPPALEDSVWVCDPHAKSEVALPRVLDRLAREEVVFFGETHLDETTHRLELAVYEGLAERTGGKVVLLLEMFERDVQPALDDYLAGRIGEGDFRMRARAWGNYVTGYRPLVEAAKRRGLPVVASNAPVSLRRKVGMGGKEALDALTPEERALLPDELHENPDAYWDRVMRAVRGHAMFRPGPDGRLTSAQSLWDNTMGDSCARALSRHPGHVVLHVNGAFHSQFREGVVHQLLVRRPGTRVAVLEAVPVDEFRAFDPFGARDRADYLAFVRRRASGPSQGFHSVVVAPELRFRLRVPPHAEEPLPLLVWLADDGFRASDGLALWTAALGDEAAVAVLEPPYPFVADDLGEGGRWYGQETFDGDLGVLGAALEEVVGYVARSYPVDRSRVAVAGEGTGATVVAAAALHSGAGEVPFLAVAPRRFSKLRTLGLPGPGERGSLRVLALEADLEWWKKEGEDYATAGLEVDVGTAPADAWERLRQAEDEVRAKLRLASRPLTAGEETVLSLEHDTPRARDWAHRYALRLGGPVRFGPDGKTLSIRPEDLQDGRGLPLSSGPFGGTTILIVPKEVPHAGWKALEEGDVIKKRSRFARLVVLLETEEGTGLADALGEVRSAGRRSVLVVPALFCADAEAMRRWGAEGKPYEDSLDLEWLPGLGGRLHLIGQAPEEE